LVTSTGEIREIDTGYVGKVNRDHLRREIQGTRGERNPKAKKKIASKHRRIRRGKTENFRRVSPMSASFVRLLTSCHFWGMLGSNR